MENATKVPAGCRQRKPKPNGGKTPLTVELAYLRRLLQEDVPLFALMRASPVDVLLDRHGIAAFADRISGDTPWGRPDLLARILARGGRDTRSRARSTVRRLALARAAGPLLGPMLRRHLPSGTAYLNIGHSNLKPRVLQAVRSVPRARITVFLHDTIPVDFPQFAGAGQVERFADSLATVSAHADLVIYNSEQSRRDAERHFSGMERVPEGLVAHLAVEPPRPEPAQLPPGLPLDRPWFVTIGTIEPRKNHALLLDLWQQMHEALPPSSIPRLFIIGRRGWKNEALFRRLDEAPFMGDTVIELAGLDDGAVAALLQGARALLFPSHAEGFGLPLLEAAALGVPVICNDLPIYREFAGSYPIYAPVHDRYQWARKLAEALDDEAMPRPAAILDLPSWNKHFQSVLKLT